MKRALLALTILSLSFGAVPARALVNYDKGSRVVKGVQLLQDHDDPTAYYYLPQFPHLSSAVVFGGLIGFNVLFVTLGLRQFRKKAVH